jgi:hypothetical protein
MPNFSLKFHNLVFYTVFCYSPFSIVLTHRGPWQWQWSSRQYEQAFDRWAAGKNLKETATGRLYRRENRQHTCGWKKKDENRTASQPV